jgi:hypothetical protein
MTKTHARYLGSPEAYQVVFVLTARGQVERLGKKYSNSVHPTVITNLWKEKGQNHAASLTPSFFLIKKNVHYELVILCIYFSNVTLLFSAAALILPWVISYKVLP